MKLKTLFSWKNLFFFVLTKSLLLLSACSYKGNFLVNNPIAETSNFPILSYLKNSINHTNNPENAQNSTYSIPKYNQSNAYIFQFLKSRVISLTTTYQNVINIGTGTILAKVSSNQNDYHFYVATNLHFAKNFLNYNQVNFKAQFHYNPYLQLEQPTEDQLLDQEQISFDLANNYLNFKNHYDANPIVWTATNLEINDYQILVSENNNNKWKIIKSNQQQKNSFFDQEGIEHRFAADLAILKLDFANLFSLKQHQLNNNWSLYQTLFINNVLNKDVKFNYQSNTDGYILGFPKNINQANNPKTKIGMVNLKLSQQNLNSNLEDGGNFYPPYVFQNDQNIATINFQNHTYFTSLVSDYVINQLNLQPGASGSIFVHYDNNHQEVYLNGIYWGITAEVNDDDNSKKQNKQPLLVDSHGWITKFTDPGHYDLIGSSQTNLSNTPANNSFCNYLRDEISKQNQNRSVLESYSISSTSDYNKSQTKHLVLPSFC
ncbi:hypothetical protein MCAV_01800 [[Mycoplasma] cavipharyngis]|uniref:hypothetical protein n=1 Tax=[Mycoplasma] cavipharyngis TaxID=92757 RepID=UPI0037043706